jgi:hypothetical protein
MFIKCSPQWCTIISGQSSSVFVDRLCLKPTGISVPLLTQMFFGPPQGSFSVPFLCELAGQGLWLHVINGGSI